MQREGREGRRAQSGSPAPMIRFTSRTGPNLCVALPGKWQASDRRPWEGQLKTKRGAKA